MTIKSTSFRIPKQLADRLDEHPPRNQLSRSSLIKEALVRWLEREAAATHGLKSSDSAGR